MLRTVLVFFVKIFSLIFFRVKRIGKENIPQQGAYIMCANHNSNWDSLIIASNTPRKMHIMAKQELFRNKFLKWFWKKCLVFPVKRGKMDINSIKHSLQILKNGEMLMLFPEGTRVDLDTTGKARNGAAFISIRTGVPVIPVAIIGKRRFFHKIVLNYGKPLDFSKYRTNRPEKEVLDKVSKEIMDNINILRNIEK